MAFQYLRPSKLLKKLLALNYEITPRRPGDVEAIYSDSKKAYDVLGWKTEYNIHDMMSTAWKWQLYLNEQTGRK
jgi:UDP-glucose 4-epimerase